MKLFNKSIVIILTLCLFFTSFLAAEGKNGILKKVDKKINSKTVNKEKGKCLSKLKKQINKKNEAKLINKVINSKLSENQKTAILEEIEVISSEK